MDSITWADQDELNELYKQVSTLKDTNSKSDTPSHIHHFNISNELLNSMEKQRPEKYLSLHDDVQG